jgi:Phasin protein.
MSNDVFSHRNTFAFNGWKEFGQIGAEAATKLAEQQLGLAGALLDMGSRQLKLLSELNGVGELWSRQAKLGSEYNDLVVEHMRKITEVITEYASTWFEKGMSMLAQPGKQAAATPKAATSKREAALA